MIGFLIGTVCLIGLIKVARSRRGCGGYAGYSGDFGEGSCHEQGRGFGRGGPPWPRRGGGGFARGGFWLRRVLQQLDTTPGQEKVIREAVDELHAAADKVRGEAKAARPDVAKAIRNDQFDETVFGDISARIDDAAQTMRRAMIDAIAKVHPVLDERQRAILADFLESGPRWARGGGSPYRSAWM